MYLPHGVDTEAFDPRLRNDSWRRSRSPQKKQILLFAGRLVWEKDLQTLIEVYKLLESERDDWILMLAGNGPIRGALEAAMPRALFLGNLHGSDLSVAYASSDIFVFPSTSETFGNVTLEAMASGVVPICVREGGASALIRDGETGFVAQPRNPREIVSRIRELLDDPGRRAEMAKRAREFALLCEWERVFDRLFQTYDEVVNGTLSAGLDDGRQVA
jgi:glycosyltransferase involved in cell wall biosynthesis